MAIKTKPTNVGDDNDTTYAALSIEIPKANYGTSIFLSQITDTADGYTQYTRISGLGGAPQSPHDPVTDFELGRGGDLVGKIVRVEIAIDKLEDVDATITYEIEAGHTLLQMPADQIKGVNGTASPEYINVDISFF